MSKRTELAFRARISAMTTAERELAIELFRSTLEHQRQRVSELEAELKQE